MCELYNFKIYTLFKENLRAFLLCVWFMSFNLKFFVIYHKKNSGEGQDLQLV